MQFVQIISCKLNMMQIYFGIYSLLTKILLQLQEHLRMWKQFPHI